METTKVFDPDRDLLQQSVDEFLKKGGEIKKLGKKTEEQECKEDSYKSKQDRLWAYIFQQDYVGS